MAETEGGNVELEYAPLLDRFLGTVIDGIFLAITLLLVIVLPPSMVAGYIFIWFAFVLFYQFILEGIWTNQTVGKYAIGMRVATIDGSSCGITHSLIRNIVGTVGQAFGWFGLLVGAFAIHQSDRNQRLGDNLAGTVVVKIP